MSTAAGRRSGRLVVTEKRRLALLGLPTFALALAITVVSTYLPTVARTFTPSNIVIGLLIGGEGLGAVALPIVVGSWSDRLRTRWGGRLPFVLAGTPLAVVALVGLGLVGSLGAMAVAVFAFFVGYFVAYEPYRALYPDLIRDDAAGRAQSTQAVWRGLGTGLALVAGGLLLTVGQAAPFVAAAVVVTLSVGSFLYFAGGRVRRSEPAERASGDVRESVRETLGLLRRHGPLRAFFVANALWELAIAGMKTFLVLWMTRGLGLSLSGSALFIGAGAVLVLVGAAFSGRLADRIGARRVMSWAVVAFGAPMFVVAATTFRPLLAVAVVPITLGGGVLLSLPYALLQPLMPSDRHGALTGYYSLSRGVGVMLGPLLAGVAVTASRGLLDSTQGYAATWAVCGVAALASLPALRRVGDGDGDGDGDAAA